MPDPQTGQHFLDAVGSLGKTQPQVQPGEMPFHFIPALIEGHIRRHAGFQLAIRIIDLQRDGVHGRTAPFHRLHIARGELGLVGDEGHHSREALAREGIHREGGRLTQVELPIKCLGYIDHDGQVVQLAQRMAVEPAAITSPALTVEVRMTPSDGAVMVNLEIWVSISARLASA